MIPTKVCILIFTICISSIHAPCLYLYYLVLDNSLSCSYLLTQLVQQKDGIQAELTRMSLAKTKLESLCRELQKHSKAVVVSDIH